MRNAYLADGDIHPPAFVVSRGSRRNATVVHPERASRGGQARVAYASDLYCLDVCVRLSWQALVRVLMVFRWSHPVKVRGAIVRPHTILVVDVRLPIRIRNESCSNKSVNPTRISTTEAHRQIAVRASPRAQDVSGARVSDLPFAARLVKALETGNVTPNHWLSSLARPSIRLRVTVRCDNWIRTDRQ